VAEHFAGFHRWPITVYEMQIGTAYRTCSHLYDDGLIVLDRRIFKGVAAYVAFAVPAGAPSLLFSLLSST
jgi:hypothetical protein